MSHVWWYSHTKHAHMWIHSSTCSDSHLIYMTFPLCGLIHSYTLCGLWLHLSCFHTVCTGTKLWAGCLAFAIMHDCFNQPAVTTHEVRGSAKSHMHFLIYTCFFSSLFHFFLCTTQRLHQCRGFFTFSSYFSSLLLQWRFSFIIVRPTVHPHIHISVCPRLFFHLTVLPVLAAIHPSTHPPTHRHTQTHRFTH